MEENVLTSFFLLNYSHLLYYCFLNIQDGNRWVARRDSLDDATRVVPRGRHDPVIQLYAQTVVASAAGRRKVKQW